MKKAACYFLVIVLVCTMVIPAHAAVVDNTIQPKWSYLNSVSANIDINWLGVATCTGQANTMEAVTVKVVTSLQQYTENGWVTLRSWSSSGTGSATASGQYAVYRGYTYRAFVTAYVYDSNGAIKESGSSSKAIIF